MFRRAVYLHNVSIVRLIYQIHRFPNIYVSLLADDWIVIPQTINSLH